MPDLIPISTLDDPRVADYANLKDRQLLISAGERPAGGVFIAEGELVARKLFESRFRTRSVLVADKRVEGLADAIAALPAATPVYVCEQRVMDGVVGFPFHRGILAAGERGAGLTMDEVASKAAALVVLEDLTNTDNLGSVFRNTAALGGARAGVLLSPGCCDPLYRKPIRVSMGHALRVPFAVCEPWPGGLAGLRRAGFTVVALTPASDAVDIRHLSAIPRPALLLGSEGPGLSRVAQAAADVRVRIPMGDGVDSVNVATAGAIALHRLGMPNEG